MRTERSEGAGRDTAARRATGVSTWSTGVRGLVVGALAAVATLLVLEVALPGKLPSWVGFALAALGFGFSYARIFLAWRARRVERRSSPA